MMQGACRRGLDPPPFNFQIIGTLRSGPCFPGACFAWKSETACRDLLSDPAGWRREEGSAVQSSRRAQVSGEPEGRAGG